MYYKVALPYVYYFTMRITVRVLQSGYNIDRYCMILSNYVEKLSEFVECKAKRLKRKQ